MNGVVILRQLLAADAALTAIVPATRISAGSLPESIELPAISISTVSVVDRNIPAPGATRFVTERIQVTVYERSYPAKRTLLAAVRKAAADQSPTVSGLSNVTVHTESAGPDFMNEQASIYVGSQDFMARYLEER